MNVNELKYESTIILSVGVRYSYSSSYYYSMRDLLSDLNNYA